MRIYSKKDGEDQGLNCDCSDSVVRKYAAWAYGLLEKLVVTQMVKKLKFVPVFISIQHWTVLSHLQYSLHPHTLFQYYLPFYAKVFQVTCSFRALLPNPFIYLTPSVAKTIP